MTKTANTYRIAFWSLFSFIVICFGILYLTDPYSGDDIGFMGQFRYYNPNLPSMSEFSNQVAGIAETFYVRYNDDVARIGNFLAALMLFVPGWISGLIFTACFGCSLWMCTRLAKLSTEDFFPFCLLAFLLVVGVIWGDNMFSVMYAYNYTCSMFLMLLVIALFLRPRHVSLWKIVPLGVVFGGWHESFTVAFLGGAIVTLVLHRDMLRADRIAMVLSVAVGMLFIITAPAWGSRAEQTAFQSGAYLIRQLYAWPFYLFILIAGVTVFTKQRKLLLCPMELFALASGGLLLVTFFSNRFRACFPALVLAAPAITFLLHEQWKMRGRKHTKALKVAAGLLGMFVVAHLGATSLFAFRFRAEGIEIQRRLDLNNRTEKNPWLFVPITYRHECSPLTLARPVKYEYLPFHGTYNSHRGYYNRMMCNDSIGMCLVPEELRHYDASEALTVKSNVGARIYKGHLVCDDTSIPYFISVNITYDGWRHENTPCYVMPFISDDGYIHFYLRPVRSTISNYLGEPTEIYAIR